MPSTNPYEQCPLYETRSFSLRLVAESDAADLLQCYSDPVAVRLMNSDNCNTDFLFTTLDRMRKYISFWLAEYRAGGYVRFAIVDRETSQAVGTIEMFGRAFAGASGRFGVLRLDIRSEYERQDRIGELLRLATAHFGELFGVDRIITKAIPEARERVAALEACGFSKVENRSLVPYDHYYTSPELLRGHQG